MAEAAPRVFEASGGVWAQLRVEAMQAAAEEPLLASYLHASILHHDKIEDALSYHLAQKLGHGDLSSLQLREVIREVYDADPGIAVQAARDVTQWKLEQKTQAAPQAGWVQDTLYRVGERVAVAQPVLVLLPAAELRARFYVPQAEINRLKLGQEVTVKLDGKEPLKAKVSFISTQVEFTPPVIYSDSQNYKYVFMVEADFDPAVARELHTGQPAEVSLQP